MTIALMQPYFLPYIGYFQLINAVDKFVFNDDALFIKGGWINRNNILVNKEKYMFTIPVQRITSTTIIKESIISDNPKNWNRQFILTLNQYRKAPYFDAVAPFITEILRGCIGASMGDTAIESIRQVMQYIGLETPLSASFEQYDNTHLKLGERVVDICLQEKADTYINAIGGQALYTKEYFANYGINLQFLKPTLKTYSQNTPEFFAGLSILDVLMFNDPATVKTMLEDYTLI